jgi:hypothetical protein
VKVGAPCSVLLRARLVWRLSRHTFQPQVWRPIWRHTKHALTLQVSGGKKYTCTNMHKDVIFNSVTVICIPIFSYI